jgi:hypothetical protein
MKKTTYTPKRRKYYLTNKKAINSKINYFQKLGRLASKNDFSISSDGKLTKNGKEIIL